MKADFTYGAVKWYCPNSGMLFISGVWKVVEIYLIIYLYFFIIHFSFFKHTNTYDLGHPQVLNTNIFRSLCTISSNYVVFAIILDYA